MQTQILIGIGALIIVIGLLWFFIWHRRNNKVQSEYSRELWKAIYEVDEQRVRALLQEDNRYINESNESDQTPLYYICGHHHHSLFPGILDSLLEQENIKINKTNKDGETPLYTACQEGHEAIVTTLLENDRIEINKAANDGTTPLSIAAAFGHSVVAAILREKGAK
tara:strand:+ start:420 stop:920 length:501 start_codon:yes stop_codon:yes gene_type:complete